MSTNFWKDKRVVITGGNGFLGRHLVEKVKAKNPKEIFIPSRSKYDLRRYEDCLRVAKKRGYRNPSCSQCRRNWLQ